MLGRISLFNALRPIVVCGCDAGTSTAEVIALSRPIAWSLAAPHIRLRNPPADVPAGGLSNVGRETLGESCVDLMLELVLIDALNELEEVEDVGPCVCLLDEFDVRRT